MSSHHLGQTPSRDHVSCMNESVEMPCALLDLFSHVVVHLHVEDVCDKVESILIVVNFGVESCKVEPVCEVVLVDLAEILIATSGYELREESADKQFRPPRLEMKNSIRSGRCVPLRHRKRDLCVHGARACPNISGAQSRDIDLQNLLAFFPRG